MCGSLGENILKRPYISCIVLLCHVTVMFMFYILYSYYFVMESGGTQQFVYKVLLIEKALEKVKKMELAYIQCNIMVVNFVQIVVFDLI